MRRVMHRPSHQSQALCIYSADACRYLETHPSGWKTIEPIDEYSGQDLKRQAHRRGRACRSIHAYAFAGTMALDCRPGSAIPVAAPSNDRPAETLIAGAKP